MDGSGPDWLGAQERPACENDYYRVYLRRVDTPQGEALNDYMVVVPRNCGADLVAGVAVLPIVDGQIALLHILRLGTLEDSWEAPMGFVEPGEGPAAAARRELAEETGLTCAAADIRSLGYITPAAGILAARIHLFVAEECTPERPFEVREHGHRRMQLFDGDRVAEMARDSTIQDASTLTAWYRYAASSGPGAT